MRNLSPATRQKLAILLKSKAAGQMASPNMAPPPVVNAPLKMPLIPSVASTPTAPNGLNAGSMDKQAKFKQLKEKFRF